MMQSNCHFGFRFDHYMESNINHLLFQQQLRVSVRYNFVIWSWYL